jgi:hypothetical protein
MGEVKNLTVAGFVADFYQETAPVEFGGSRNIFSKSFLIVTCLLSSRHSFVQSGSLSLKGAFPQRLALPYAFVLDHNLSASRRRGEPRLYASHSGAWD